MSIGKTHKDKFPVVYISVITNFFFFFLTWIGVNLYPANVENMVSS
jgi:hypothetical protein